MLDHVFSVVRLLGGCRSRVRVPMQYACNRAGSVFREGEGSTGPSRGEHRLTVYRAHASRDFHEQLTFLKLPRKLPGNFYDALGVLRVF